MQEDEKKTQVAEVVGRLTLLEQELDRLCEVQVQQRKEHREKLKRGAVAVELNNYSSYLTMLRNDIKAQERKIATVQGELDKRRAELVELMRERKALEKLKEKQYEQYKKELAKEQEKEIDDFVSYKAFVG